jgi:DNA-binding protein YbaB
MKPLVSFIIILELCSFASAYMTPLITLHHRMRNKHIGLFFNRNSKVSNIPSMNDLSDLMGIMNKAQSIAEEGQRLISELDHIRIVGTDPLNEVNCTFNGLTIPVDVKISQSLMSKSSEIVSAHVTSAIIDGHKKSRDNLVEQLTLLFQKSGFEIPSDIQNILSQHTSQIIDI